MIAFYTIKYMKIKLLILLTLISLFSFSCTAQNNSSVQSQKSNEAVAGNPVAEQNETNSSENQSESINSSPVSSSSISSGNESIYTDLAAEKCKTIESNPDEGGSYRGECVGVGGFKLEVLEGDLRQTLNVIFPNGKKSELDFMLNVSSAFSVVGDKAEWRVTGKGKNAKPYALIIRYNANENVEKPEVRTSYLVVTKITKDSACITDIIKPTTDQNKKAQKAADESANKPCFSKE